MNKMLRIFLPLTLMTGFLFSQTVEGNYELNYVTVHYTYEIRDSSSADDAIASYAVTASWPSSVAAAAGQGYTHTLSEYETGDTLATTLIPLVTPELLAYAGYLLTGDPTAPGVAINIDFNDDGTFTINDGSTYPTTETINCSTTATIPNVSENGTWVGTTGFFDESNTAYTFGWGISLSNVFAQFGAPDLINMVNGVDYGVGTDMENWGMMTVQYSDDTHSQPTDINIYWEAHDGVASGLGVDEDGEFNGHVGVPVVDSDTTTIPYVSQLASMFGIDIVSVTDYPMIGGEGVATDSISVVTGETVYEGVVAANWGYLFDPLSTDGEPFTGDEPLQATGYFFTYNFLEAVGYYTAVLQGMLALGVDLQSAITAASDSVASIYVSSDTSAAIGAGVGESIYADYVACVGAGGGEACDAIIEAGPTMTLVAVTQYCPDCWVNDSDTLSGWEEYYGYMIPTPGRLVFEIDNVCIPDNTTQRVNPKFYNTEVVSIDKDAPIAGEFKLHGNYPNPFNPSTSIKYSTEKFSDVTVTVYSLLGEEVAILQNGKIAAGTYDVKWYGQDKFGNKVPSGVYFYEVRSDNRTATGKMLLLK